MSFFCQRRSLSLRGNYILAPPAAPSEAKGSRGSQVALRMCMPGGFLLHHAHAVAFLMSLNGAGHVWLSSTAIDRDHVCSASHKPGRSYLILASTLSGAQAPNELAPPSRLVIGRAPAGQFCGGLSVQILLPIRIACLVAVSACDAALSTSLCIGSAIEHVLHSRAEAALETTRSVSRQGPSLLFPRSVALHTFCFGWACCGGGRRRDSRQCLFDPFRSPDRLRRPCLA